MAEVPDVPILSLADAFHTGFVVPHLEPAMAELTDVLGIRWTGIEDWPMRIRTPDAAVDVHLRFVYSTGQSPPFVELIEPVPGTVWETPSSSLGPGGAHHMGVWADDFADTSDRMVAAGFPRLLTFEQSSGRPAGFAYHRLPSGALIELVDAASRSGLEAWLAGGPHPRSSMRRPAPPH